MRLRPDLAALLCFTTCMCMIHATDGLISNCCVGWSDTRILIQRIENYTIQSEGICPVKAIIFHTKLGKNLCSNPNDPWAKRAMRKVDLEEEKKKTLQERDQNEDRSISDITPTAATKSKKMPRRRRKGKNGRRRQRKWFRAGRRGQKQV